VAKKFNEVVDTLRKKNDSPVQGEADHLRSAHLTRVFSEFSSSHQIILCG